MAPRPTGRATFPQVSSQVARGSWTVSYNSTVRTRSCWSIGVVRSHSRCSTVRGTERQVACGTRGCIFTKEPTTCTTWPIAVPPGTTFRWRLLTMVSIGPNTGLCCANTPTPCGWVLGQRGSRRSSTSRARFYLNFSEWRGNQQTIFFAESSDLLHWQRLDNRYEFKPDPQWYNVNDGNNSRWDCIYTIPRESGGLYGYWTATPQAATEGRFGFGETTDGITWRALQPPRVRDVDAGEVGAIERIGDRYYMMFGSGGIMITLVADRPEGPFVPATQEPSVAGGSHVFRPVLSQPRRFARESSLHRSQRSRILRPAQSHSCG